MQLGIRLLAIKRSLRYIERKYVAEYEVDTGTCGKVRSKCTR